jgi:vacuolar-type H+-ATPase subunit I/STV1
MSALPTDPPQNPEHELFETLLSKFIVTFLFAILGFVLVLLAYVIPSTFDFDETVFETSSSTYFTVSIAIWMLIGLTTPFISLRRVFEELKGIMIQHVVIFITAVVVFVFIYWFIITFIVSTIVSIFGIE